MNEPQVMNTLDYKVNEMSALLYCHRIGTITSKNNNGTYSVVLRDRFVLKDKKTLPYEIKEVHQTFQQNSKGGIYFQYEVNDEVIIAINDTPISKWVANAKYTDDNILSTNRHNINDSFIIGLVKREPEVYEGYKLKYDNLTIELLDGKISIKNDAKDFKQLMDLFFARTENELTTILTGLDAMLGGAFATQIAILKTGYRLDKTSFNELFF